jgi:DNA polymerase V
MSQSKYNLQDKFMQNHGGKREGAGRKSGSGKYKESTQAMRVPESLIGEVKDFIQLRRVKNQRIPLYMSSVPAGSPSILEDHVEDFIDLNEYLLRDSEETFMVMADGESMLGANIKSGDVLIVDRSMEPRHNHIVIAALDGNLTVKRLQVNGKSVTLKPENNEYDVITIKKGNSLHIWGVVTHIIHKSV